MQNFALVGEQQGRVRDLAGFRRSHRVPDEDSDRAQAFVRRISAEDIGRDLDQRFADFRRQLGLKRVDMDVTEPHDGSGGISTPDFQYQISASLDDADPSELIWRRQVTHLRTPDVVLSERFAAAFGTIFDTVEFVPPEPVDVESFIDWMEDQADGELKPDYDRTATWCRLTAPATMSATMLVQPHLVSLKSLVPCSAETLMRSFLAFQTLLPSLDWTKSPS